MKSKPQINVAQADDHSKKHRFNTSQEVINDPNFKDNVAKILSDIRQQRANRPQLADGYRYKKDWFDRMNKADQLNAKFFMSNIESIWAKQSHLSREMREVIKYVCDKALFQTLAFYAKQDKAEAVTDQEEMPTN